jgi:hypothetical protein
MQWVSVCHEDTRPSVQSKTTHSHAALRSGSKPEIALAPPEMRMKS